MPIAQPRLRLPLALLLLCSPALGFAQNIPNQSPNPPTYNGAREIVDGAHIPPLPNASFSAKVELQTTQILADGTRVTRRTFNIIARDFRGRTHNEMRAWMPPDGSEPKLTYSVVYDPDTRTRTFLYPAMRLARQFVLNSKSVSLHPTANAANNPLAPTIQKENLGVDFKDGLQLKGVRETRTYPANSIGNDRPLAIVNEYWYSADLQLNISVKRTDPRFGTQTVQLTNLRRAEPDVSLFDVPADYRVENETGMTESVAAVEGNAPPSYNRLRMGGTVQAAKLLNRVQPEYPVAARQGRIQGTVRLHVVVLKDGAMGTIELISGHPLLAHAAIEAVRQWRYQPTLLNGEPVEVDTTIDVIFALNLPPPT